MKEAETSKDRIANATLMLVADRGIHAVTTSEVIKTMGITRATMASHCPSEGDLWLAVAALIQRHMTKAWSAVAGEELSPIDRLRSLLGIQVRLIVDTPALRELLLSGRCHADNHTLRRGLSDVRQRFKSQLIEALTDGQRTGQIREGLDARVIANRIIETIQGMAVSLSFDRQPSDPAEEIWVRLDAFLNGTADRSQSPTRAHKQCELS